MFSVIRSLPWSLGYTKKIHALIRFSAWPRMGWNLFYISPIAFDGIRMFPNIFLFSSKIKLLNPNIFFCFGNLHRKIPKIFLVFSLESLPQNRYSDLPNNRAANLIIILGKKDLHNLIRTYMFINFWKFSFKTRFSPT